MRRETETRWILLGSDGLHVSLGRTEPSEAEVATASDALAAQGLSGWLNRMQSDYYSRGKVSVEPLQRIGIAHDAVWQAALAAFTQCATESRGLDAGHASCHGFLVLRFTGDLSETRSRVITPFDRDRLLQSER